MGNPAQRKSVDLPLKIAPGQRQPRIPPAIVRAEERGRMVRIAAAPTGASGGLLVVGAARRRSAKPSSQFNR
jgi:hypothetical protein